MAKEIKIQTKVIPSTGRSKYNKGGTGSYHSSTVVNNNTSQQSDVEIMHVDTDEALFSDSNVLSSLRSIKEILSRIISDTDEATEQNTYSAAKVNAIVEAIDEAIVGKLSKDKPDSTDFLQKFNKGAEFGQYGEKKGAYINEEGIGDFEKVVSKDTDFKEMHADSATMDIATINELVAKLAEVHKLSVTDTANILRAVVGSISSEKFVSGFAGEGFRISQAINGDWNLEIDNLIVRKLFNVFELLVQEIKHQGGMVLHSPAGGKITKVTDGGSHWKCEIESADTFFKDDLVICQKFTGTIKRYWRAVTSVGTGYINLSKTDCEANSAIPQIGDEIAVQGNKTNISRQSVYIINVVGEDAPYTAYYSGINSYSLKDKLVTREGNLNGIVDKDFGALKGYGLYATNSYLKGILRLTNGKTVEQELLSTNNTVEANRLQLGGEIDKAKTDAKNANDKIDGLEIGGVNLADNSLTTKWYTYPAAVVFEYINNYARIPLPLVGDVKEIGCGIISKTDTNTSYSQSLIIRTDGKLNSFKFSFFSSVTSHRLIWAKISQINTNAYYCEATTRTTDKQINTRVGNVHDLKIDGGTYVEFGYPCLVQGKKSMKWTPSLSDQQTELKKLDTSIRTDFDVTEGQINANVAKTETLVNQTTGLVEESKQTASQVNQTAIEINQNVSRAEQSATRAETAEANINTKADGIVMEASKQSAEKAIDGLEIGGRNYFAFYKMSSYAPYNSLPTLIDGTKIRTVFNNGKFFTIGSEAWTKYNMIEDGVFIFSGYITINGEIPLNNPFKNLFNNYYSYHKDSVYDSKSGFLCMWSKVTKSNPRQWVMHASVDSLKTGDIIIIDKPQLERATKVSDWSPAPEDTDTQFQATKARLELLDNQFAVEVSKTDGIRKDLTTLSQNHDSFKVQVKTDINGAIDSNNEVIKSSFEMNGNKIGLLGSEIDITGKVTFSALNAESQAKINDAKKSADNAAQDIWDLKLEVGDLAYLDVVEKAMLGTTVIEGGFIKTELIKTDELVSKKVKTANSGPRFEMEGSEMRVYGDGVHPNMIFGVNEAGYAVMEYYTADGVKLYDLGPSGLDVINFAPVKWTEKRLKQFSTTLSRDNLTWMDFQKIRLGNVTQANAPIFYTYYAGGNPTVTPEEREREKYTYSSINGSKIANGWYYFPPYANDRGYEQHPSNNSGGYIKPESDGLYDSNEGVVNRNTIYIVQCYLYVGGVITDSANYYFQENPKNDGGGMLTPDR